MLSEADAKQRIRNLENAEEQRIATLLLNLGFTAVDFNAKIYAESRQLIGEIDSLFVFENNLLIVETTNERRPSVDSIVGWFVKWSEEANIERIFATYGLSLRNCLAFSRPWPMTMSP